MVSQIKSSVCARIIRERTYALFSTKYEGLGWESENIAFRIYFDPRNAIDIYGKRRRSLQLRMYATPEYPYHEESPEGRDIFKVGDSIGIGAMAAWVDGKVVKAADVKERAWRIISLGPVRTIVEVEYRGWNLGEQDDYGAFADFDVGGRAWLLSFGWRLIRKSPQLWLPGSPSCRMFL